MSDTIENPKRTIDQIIEKIGDLPSAPPILNKAMKLTSDVDSKISDISRSIAADQSISAKVIRMSNSPLYARSRRVSNLEEAITVLGFNQMKSIIITASTFQMFESCDHSDIATKLWHHSFSTAIAARIVAQKLTGLNKEDAYLAGLLHDIGKLILLKTAPNVYTNLVDIVSRDKVGFLSEERKELGFDHADLGAALLSKWDIPKNIVTAVSDHHKCNLEKSTPSEKMARVVALADFISLYIGTDFEAAYETPFAEEYYLGPNVIEGDRMIMIQCDTESEFNSELSLLSG